MSAVLKLMLCATANSEHYLLQRNNYRALFHGITLNFYSNSQLVAEHVIQTIRELTQALLYC